MLMSHTTWPAHCLPGGGWAAFGGCLGSNRNHSLLLAYGSPAKRSKGLTSTKNNSSKGAGVGLDVATIGILDWWEWTVATLCPGRIV